MVVYTGKTVREAIQLASQSLHKPEKELKVEIIDQPRRGFLGIGRRPAKIEATVKPPIVKQNQTTVTATTKKATPKVKPHETQAPVGKAVVVPTNDGKRGGEEDPAVIAARHEANVRHTRNAGQQLTVYLKKIFHELGIKTNPEITKVEAHAIAIDIKTPNSGRVIGHHGQRINALEQVSAAFMNYHGAPKTRVILDTSNYRQRRRQALHEIAERSVTEVVASGQAVYLDPMPARERKQLHQELEGNSHVRTYSHGREPYRSVVIAPHD